MKIAALCCTYLRPRQLGFLLRCFELQDYADRELIILDDAGQYGNLQGDRWTLVSLSRRFCTLGEKRNAIAALASPDVEAFAVWDDDDLYLPWALSASAAALQNAAWSRPSIVLHPTPDGTLKQHETRGLFHGGWAYRRDTFEAAGRYPAMSNGEDMALMRRMSAIGAAEADPIGLGFAPFYIYLWGNTSGARHLSGMGADGYRKLATQDVPEATLVAGNPPQCDLRNPVILPGVQPRRF